MANDRAVAGAREPRMIAMDLDLTLVDYPPSGAHIEPETVAFLVGLIERGVEVGIVTGRDLWATRTILTLAGVRFAEPFPTFLVSRENNIHWLRGGQTIDYRAWNDLVADRLARFAKGVSVYVNEWIEELQANSLPPKKWILFSDFGMEIHFPTNEQAAAACTILGRWRSRIPEMAIHRNRMMANLVHMDSGKGVALREAARAKEIPVNEVLAIGDSLNDLSMLDGSHGFLSGTVENGDPAVKQAVLDNRGIVASRPVSLGLLDVVRVMSSIEVVTRDGK